jgi:hypothetical protein
MNLDLAPLSTKLSPVGWALPATTKKSLFYRWCAVPTLWLLGMVQDVSYEPTLQV